MRSDLRALSPSPDSAKKKKLSKKSPIRIHNVFRRTNSRPDSVDAPFSVCGAPMLFGQPLSTLCQNDTLPPPVLVSEADRQPAGERCSFGRNSSDGPLRKPPRETRAIDCHARRRIKHVPLGADSSDHQDAALLNL